MAETPIQRLRLVVVTPRLDPALHPDEPLVTLLDLLATPLTGPPDRLHLTLLPVVSGGAGATHRWIAQHVPTVLRVDLAPLALNLGSLCPGTGVVAVGVTERSFPEGAYVHERQGLVPLVRWLREWRAAFVPCPLPTAPLAR